MFFPQNFQEIKTLRHNFFQSFLIETCIKNIKREGEKEVFGKWIYLRQLLDLQATRQRLLLRNSLGELENKNIHFSTADSSQSTRCQTRQEGIVWSCRPLHLPFSLRAGFAKTICCGRFEGA